MDNKDFNNSYAQKIALQKNKDYSNNDQDSAIENNKHDLVSNQGSSGVKDVQMGEEKSKIELAYQIRSERFDRDEENPMYDASDEPFGAPDRF
ncbi:MAG: hypothetical protein CVV02_00655 [Firmicutes bacterium HGW-Firmicutes-7]|nr:MAG: hypothetical protein CVV02_00655 [Firmicutes bacterium HGW-Firmicutes-7]